MNKIFIKALKKSALCEERSLKFNLLLSYFDATSASAAGAGPTSPLL